MSRVHRPVIGIVYACLHDTRSPVQRATLNTFLIDGRVFPCAMGFPAGPAAVCHTAEHSSLFYFCAVMCRSVSVAVTGANRRRR